MQATMCAIAIWLLGVCSCYSAGALFKACVDGDAAYVELLINNGMSPSTSDYNQRTPLHLAASNGHTHIVHFLCNQTVRSRSCTYVEHITLCAAVHAKLVASCMKFRKVGD